VETGEEQQQYEVCDVGMSKLVGYGGGSVEKD